MKTTYYYYTKWNLWSTGEYRVYFRTLAEAKADRDEYLERLFTTNTWGNADYVRAITVSRHDTIEAIESEMSCREYAKVEREVLSEIYEHESRRYRESLEREFQN